MTSKQKAQYNRMRSALRTIYKQYMTPAQIRKDTKNSGLDFEEYLEMSYENIQQTAADAVRGVKELS